MGEGLSPDNGGNILIHARFSRLATGVSVAGFRSLPRFPKTEKILELLGTAP